MCKRCAENRLREAERAEAARRAKELNIRRAHADLKAMELLEADIIKGSQYCGLIKMIRATEEDLVVAEEALKNLQIQKQLIPLQHEMS